MDRLAARMELGTSEIQRLYCRRIWRLYTEAHSSDDCCAFSIIHGGAGLGNMLRLFRNGNARLPDPGCYFLDSYGFEYSALTGAASILEAAGEIAKPVYMQETYYNDGTSYADIKRALAETDLNFQCIFQWNVIRDAPDPHVFPDVFPKRFDNYLVEI